MDKKSNGRMSLRQSMVFMIIGCWVIPLILIFFIVINVMYSKLNTQIINTVTSSANKAVQNIDIRLDDLKNASRNASYFTTISDAYAEYKESGEQQKLYDKLTIYLAQQYRYNKSIGSAIVFFTENKDLFYSTYSTGSTYDSIDAFRSLSIDAALEISRQIDTDIWFFKSNGLLYMLRNLLDSQYHTYGVLALEINTKDVLEGLESIWGYDKCGVFLNGDQVYGQSFGFPAEVISQEKTNGSRLIRDNGSYYVYYTEKQEKQYVTYVVKLNSDTIMAENNTALYMFLIFIGSMIPLCLFVITFINKKVQKPVRRLVKAAGEITGGNYGYTITKSGSSVEFDYLNEAFNSMSTELKHQFEQIYVEELALKDADIKALQSQINPHFLNNTLEIINWEARLNGIDSVSSMIEALSTMLTATLNRSGVQSITLAEEMEYVDAYLHIISMRMGNRLKIEKDIDESLLKYQVPRLIIQPIIENAVEHGTKASGEAFIAIRIYSESDCMYIEVRNSGKLSEEDMEKINLLLSDRPEAVTIRKSTSIGIRNVNRRLKLMYGEECGLTIFSEGDTTVNRLITKTGENIT